MSMPPEEELSLALHRLCKEMDQVAELIKTSKKADRLAFYMTAQAAGQLTATVKKWFDANQPT